MQHHGAPTRLLDCSRSFYIAAFFALEQAFQDATIWAFNASSVRVAFIDILANSGTITADQATLLKKMVPLNYNDQLLKLKKELFRIRVRAAVLIEPFIKNERLRIQQGLFLCPLDLTSGVEQNLRGLWGLADNAASGPEITITNQADMALMMVAKIIKIVLPRNIRAAAIEDLTRMNITSTTLFPGLDGFTRSLALCFLPWSNRETPGRLAHFTAADEDEFQTSWGPNSGPKKSDLE